jgi:hypothetical protein
MRRYVKVSWYNVAMYGEEYRGLVLELVDNEIVGVWARRPSN